MESLEHVLQRLAATTRRAQNGDSPRPRANGVPHAEPDCAVCQDRGWYTPDVAAGHPDFARMTVCECQRSRMEFQRYGRLVRYSNLANLTRHTFETLDPDGRAQDAESRALFAAALRAAQRFAEHSEGFLLISGPNGSGKTHLAAAIANRRIEHGHAALFVHVPDLLDHMRAAFSPDAAISYDDLFEQVRNAPMLVLDELGGQSATPWAEEKLRQIVNHRFNTELPTVVTTTAREHELEPYLRIRLTDPQLSASVQTRRYADSWARKWGVIEPEMRRRMTFSAFDVRGNESNVDQRNSLQAALAAARNYAKDPDGWLTLFGPTGVGKTHLAVSIASERIGASEEVFFAFVPELLDHLRSAFEPGSAVPYGALFEQVKTAQLLILDGLGDETASAWGQEKLYQIIARRHNARLPTVITTQVDFSEKRGHIGSRVQDFSIGDLVRIDANDFRIRGPGG